MDWVIKTATFLRFFFFYCVIINGIYFKFNKISRGSFRFYITYDFITYMRLVFLKEKPFLNVFFFNINFYNSH